MVEGCANRLEQADELAQQALSVPGFLRTQALYLAREFDAGAGEANSFAKIRERLCVQAVTEQEQGFDPESVAVRRQFTAVDRQDDEGVFTLQAVEKSGRRRPSSPR